MRFGTRKSDGVPCLIDRAGGVVALNGRDGAPAFDSVQQLIESVDAHSPVLRHLADAPSPNRPQAATIAWAAPIPQPRRNVFCVGKNYHAHAAEFAASGYDATAGGEVAPAAPVVFTKAPECVIGPDEPIVVPRSLTAEADYEAEIAVVIGAPGRFIPVEQARAHVFGYTLLNDVTARDVQSRHRQWFLGKTIESFCPMGPWITHAAGVDASGLDIRCAVNGDARQSARAAQLIFDIPTLIATISKSITLLPGDVIATGTPAGVGIGMDPPQFLRDGDVVTIASDALGVLSNPVRVVD